MPIIVTFNGTDKQVVAEMRRVPPAVVQNLARRLTAMMVKLQAHIQRDKLQGQVLAHRSGKLANTINAHAAEVAGDVATASVTGAGGSMAAGGYGRVHESGGQRTYEIRPVRAKALAFFPGNSLGSGGGIARLSKSAIRSLYRNGRVIPSTIGTFNSYGGVVRAGVIHPPLPKRPFMAPALADMRDEITKQLSLAVGVGVGEALGQSGGAIGG